MSAFSFQNNHFLSALVPQSETGVLSSLPEDLLVPATASEPAHLLDLMHEARTGATGGATVSPEGVFLW